MRDKTMKLGSRLLRKLSLCRIESLRCAAHIGLLRSTSSHEKVSVIVSKATMNICLDTSKCESELCAFRMGAEVLAGID